MVAYGALSRGLLTGTLPEKLDPTDFRAHLPRFQGEARASNQRLVDGLNRLAGELGCTAAQRAVAWVLQRGDDIAALVGTTHPGRLAENLAAFEVRMTSDVRAALEDLFAPGAITGTRYPEAQMGLVAG